MNMILGMICFVLANVASAECVYKEKSTKNADFFFAIENTLNKDVQIFVDFFEKLDSKKKTLNKIKALIGGFFQRCPRPGELAKDKTFPGVCKETGPPLHDHDAASESCISAPKSNTPKFKGKPMLPGEANFIPKTWEFVFEKNAKNKKLDAAKMFKDSGVKDYIGWLEKKKTKRLVTNYKDHLGTRQSVVYVVPVERKKDPTFYDFLEKNFMIINCENLKAFNGKNSLFVQADLFRTIDICKYAKEVISPGGFVELDEDPDIQAETKRNETQHGRGAQKQVVRRILNTPH